MKKQIVIAAAMLVSTASFAQTSKLKAAETAIKNGDYKVAYTAIEAATKHKKTKANPKTWALKAQVLSAVQSLGMGELLGVNVKEGQVLETLMKAKELNNGESSKELDAVSAEILRGLHNEGVKAYTEDKDYEKAASVFKQKIELSKQLLPDTKIDDLDYVVVGSSYANLELNEKAIPYYEKLVESGYDDKGVYNFLIQEYKEDGDKYLDILGKAQAKYPDHQNYKLLEIDYFQKEGRIDEKLADLEEAAEVDPSNLGVLLILSEVYKAKGDVAKERATLNKVLVVEPDNATANFNLGVSYFNKAVSFNDELNFMTSNTSPEYKAAKAKRNELAQKAFPYFQKVYEVKGNDRAILNAMYQYYSMMGDKANRAKFEQLLDKK